MTGQNDRQDESLTGQVRDQAGHCPLTGRYFQPCMALRAEARGMDVYSVADVPNAFTLTLLSLFAGDETIGRWLSGAAISFAYLYHPSVLSVCIDCVCAPNFNMQALYLLIQFPY